MNPLSRQQRDVRMPKKAEQQGNIKQQSEVTWKGGQESKVVEEGSGAGKYQGRDLKISDK